MAPRLYYQEYKGIQPLTAIAITSEEQPPLCEGTPAGLSLRCISRRLPCHLNNGSRSRGGPFIRHPRWESPIFTRLEKNGGPTPPAAASAVGVNARQ